MYNKYSVYNVQKGFKMISLQAKAKINLSLDVTAKRPDGYHDLASVMQTIDLCDTVTIVPKQTNQIIVTTTSAELCDMTDNLAYRAACFFNSRFALENGYHINIIKSIPIGAGLAGGSADAAAVINGLCQLYNKKLDDKMLADIGATLGADVPFCLKGGTALAEGIGERLMPFDNQTDFYLVLVKPQESISTAQVFQNFLFDKVLEHPNNHQLISALQAGNLELAIKNMGNVLETVTVKWLPQIAEIKQQLFSFGALYAQMSGSGSTVFGIFNSLETAQAAKRQIEKRWQNVYLARPTR